MPRVLLVAGGVALLILIYFTSTFINKPRSNGSLLSEPNSNTLTDVIPNQTASQPNSQNTTATISTPQFQNILNQIQCPQNFSEILPNLSETELRNALDMIGNFKEETHWENYYYSEDGLKYIVHLVPTDAESGFEKWTLKKFKDEDDGPVFISEKTYNSQQQARADLDKLLKSESKKSKKLSWSNGSNLSITASSAEKIFDIKIETQNYVLDCTQGSCRCL